MSAVFVAIAAGLSSAPAAAQQTCNYSQSPAQNCMDAAHDYFNKILHHHSDRYDDVDKRVNSASDVVHECGDCAFPPATGEEHSSPDSSSNSDPGGAGDTVSTGAGSGDTAASADDSGGGGDAPAIAEDSGGSGDGGASSDDSGSSGSIATNSDDSGPSGDTP